jgi:hypothetical protein
LLPGRKGVREKRCQGEKVGEKVSRRKGVRNLFGQARACMSPRKGVSGEKWRKGVRNLFGRKGVRNLFGQARACMSPNAKAAILALSGLSQTLAKAA